VSLRIIGAGLQTTVQDLGRPCHQRQGSPGSGAMDRAAMRVANILIGNDDGAAVLEATLIGPAITFDQQMLIALAGGDLEPTLEEQPLSMWHPIHVPRGATLRFGRPQTGCRTYVAVAGGIDVAPVFGSRSTYLRAQFGGYQGRALRAGDELACGEPSPLSMKIAETLPLTNNHPETARWSIGHSLRSRYSPEPVVRLIGGTHMDLLAATSRTRLFSATFKVSSSSDRMGYRLNGAALPLREPVELLSEGVTFGTVQLPPDGSPIILMADRQTAGGYPRIGEVASVDLPLVAQLKPGEGLRFRPISVEEAQQLYLMQEQDLAQARSAIALRHTRGRT
jgi:antagonist of KipI